MTVKLMGIPLLDHVIVGGDNRQYFSFKEKKLLDTPKVFLETNYQSLDLSHKRFLFHFLIRDLVFQYWLFRSIVDSSISGKF
mgnify:CR=1 FL=1